MKKFKIAVCTENYDVYNNFRESLKVLEGIEVERYVSFYSIIEPSDFNVVCVDYDLIESFEDIEDFTKTDTHFILLHKSIDYMETNLAMLHLYEHFTIDSLEAPYNIDDILKSLKCICNIDSMYMILDGLDHKPTLVNPLLIRTYWNLKKGLYENDLEMFFPVGCKVYEAKGSKEELQKFQNCLNPEYVQISHIQDEGFLLLVKNIPSLIHDLKIAFPGIDLTRITKEQLKKFVVKEEETA